jgi:hypothetical protein
LQKQEQRETAIDALSSSACEEAKHTHHKQQTPRIVVAFLLPPYHQKDNCLAPSPPVTL